MLLYFPADGRSTKYGSRGAVESADKELGLAFENGHDVLLVGSLDGFHNQVACLDHASEEDEGFGGREGGKVGTCLAQHLACELVDFLGQLVALASSYGHVERGDVLRIHVAQDGGTGGGGQQLAGCAGYTRGRAVGFQTAGTSATARAAFGTAYLVT